MTVAPMLRPGMVVLVPRLQKDNRVRTYPDPNRENTTAWLEAGKTRAVILERPADWDKDYPYKNGGYLWFYVYAGRAADHSPVTGKMSGVQVEVVGWTAGLATEPGKFYLEAADTKAISK